jgi:hypothetical protein
MIEFSLHHIQSEPARRTCPLFANRFPTRDRGSTGAARAAIRFLSLNGPAYLEFLYADGDFTGEGARRLLGLPQARVPWEWRGAMLDVAMLVTGCVFLIAAVLYTLGCDLI